MVFQKYVVSLLLTVLGGFVKDLDRSEVKVSLLRGLIELNNIELSQSVIDSLGIPFTVIKAVVGSLSIRVPWTSLYSKRCEIRITDVALVVGPIVATKYDAEVDRKAEENWRGRQLAVFEVAVAAENELDSKRGATKKGSTTFFQRLQRAILANLVVKLTNITLRYEDVSTQSPHIALAGQVTIESVRVRPDTPGKPLPFGHPSSALLRHTILLSGFAMCVRYISQYEGAAEFSKRTIFQQLEEGRLEGAREFINCVAQTCEVDLASAGYVIAKSSGSVSVTMQSWSAPTDTSRPKVSCIAAVSSGTLYVDHEKIKGCSAIADYIGRAARLKAGRSTRPFGVRPTPGQGHTAVLWWQHAITQVLRTTRRERQRRRFCWAAYKEWKENCDSYFHTYLLQLLEAPRASRSARFGAGGAKALERDGSQLLPEGGEAEVEKRLTVEDVIECRCQALYVLATFQREGVVLPRHFGESGVLQYSAQNAETVIASSQPLSHRVAAVEVLQLLDDSFASFLSALRHCGQREDRAGHASGDHRRHGGALPDDYVSSEVTIEWPTVCAVLMKPHVDGGTASEAMRVVGTKLCLTVRLSNAIGDITVTAGSFQHVTLGPSSTVCGVGEVSATSMAEVTQAPSQPGVAPPATSRRGSKVLETPQQQSLFSILAPRESSAGSSDGGPSAVFFRLMSSRFSGLRKKELRLGVVTLHFAEEEIVQNIIPSLLGHEPAAEDVLDADSPISVTASCVRSDSETHSKASSVSIEACDNSTLSEQETLAMRQLAQLKGKGYSATGGWMDGLTVTVCHLQVAAANVAVVSENISMLGIPVFVSQMSTYQEAVSVRRVRAGSLHIILHERPVVETGVIECDVKCSLLPGAACLPTVEIDCSLSFRALCNLTHISDAKRQIASLISAVCFALDPRVTQAESAAVRRSTPCSGEGTLTNPYPLKLLFHLVAPSASLQSSELRHPIQAVNFSIRFAKWPAGEMLEVHSSKFVCGSVLERMASYVSWERGIVPAGYGTGGSRSGACAAPDCLQPWFPASPRARMVLLVRIQDTVLHLDHDLASQIEFLYDFLGILTTANPGDPFRELDTTLTAPGMQLLLQLRDTTMTIAPGHHGVSPVEKGYNAYVSEVAHGRSPGTERGPAPPLSACSVAVMSEHAAKRSGPREPQVTARHPSEAWFKVACGRDDGLTLALERYDDTRMVMHVQLEESFAFWGPGQQCESRVIILLPVASGEGETRQHEAEVVQFRGTSEGSMRKALHSGARAGENISSRRLLTLILRGTPPSAASFPSPDQSTWLSSMEIKVTLSNRSVVLHAETLKAVAQAFNTPFTPLHRFRCVVSRMHFTQQVQPLKVYHVAPWGQTMKFAFSMVQSHIFIPSIVRGGGLLYKDPTASFPASLAGSHGNEWLGDRPEEDDGGDVSCQANYGEQAGQVAEGIENSMLYAWVKSPLVEICITRDPSGDTTMDFDVLASGLPALVSNVLAPDSKCGESERANGSNEADVQRALRISGLVTMYGAGREVRREGCYVNRDTKVHVEAAAATAGAEPGENLIVVPVHDVAQVSQWVAFVKGLTAQRPRGGADREEATTVDGNGDKCLSSTSADTARGGLCDGVRQECGDSGTPSAPSDVPPSSVANAYCQPAPTCQGSPQSPHFYHAPGEAVIEERASPPVQVVELTTVPLLIQVELLGAHLVLNDGLSYTASSVAGATLRVPRACVLANLQGIHPLGGASKSTQMHIPRMHGTLARAFFPQGSHTSGTDLPAGIRHAHTILELSGSGCNLRETVSPEFLGRCRTEERAAIICRRSGADFSSTESSPSSAWTRRSLFSASIPPQCSSCGLQVLFGSGERRVRVGAVGLHLTSDVLPWLIHVTASLRRAIHDVAAHQTSDTSLGNSEESGIAGSHRGSLGGSDEGMLPSMRGGGDVRMQSSPVSPGRHPSVAGPQWRTAGEDAVGDAHRELKGEQPLLSISVDVISLSYGWRSRRLAEVDVQLCAKLRALQWQWGPMLHLDQAEVFLLLPGGDVIATRWCSCCGEEVGSHHALGTTAKHGAHLLGSSPPPLTKLRQRHLQLVKSMSISTRVHDGTTTLCISPFHVLLTTEKYQHLCEAGYNAYEAVSEARQRASAASQEWTGASDGVANPDVNVGASDGKSYSRHGWEVWEESAADTLTCPTTAPSAWQHSASSAGGGLGDVTDLVAAQGGKFSLTAVEFAEVLLLVSLESEPSEKKPPSWRDRRRFAQRGKQSSRGGQHKVTLSAAFREQGALSNDTEISESIDDDDGAVADTDNDIGAIPSVGPLASGTGGNGDSYGAGTHEKASKGRPTVAGTEGEVEEEAGDGSAHFQLRLRNLILTLYPDAVSCTLESLAMDYKREPLLRVEELELYVPRPWYSECGCSIDTIVVNADGMALYTLLHFAVREPYRTVTPHYSTQSPWTHQLAIHLVDAPSWDVMEDLVLSRERFVVHFSSSKTNSILVDLHGHTITVEHAMSKDEDTVMVVDDGVTVSFVNGVFSLPFTSLGLRAASSMLTLGEEILLTPFVALGEGSFVETERIRFCFFGRAVEPDATDGEGPQHPGAEENELEADALLPEARKPDGAEPVTTRRVKLRRLGSITKRDLSSSLVALLAQLSVRSFTLNAHSHRSSRVLSLQGSVDSNFRYVDQQMDRGRVVLDNITLQSFPSTRGGTRGGAAASMVIVERVSLDISATHGKHLAFAFSPVAADITRSDVVHLCVFQEDIRWLVEQFRQLGAATETAYSQLIRQVTSWRTQPNPLLGYDRENVVEGGVLRRHSDIAEGVEGGASSPILGEGVLKRLRRVVRVHSGSTVVVVPLVSVTLSDARYPLLRTSMEDIVFRKIRSSHEARHSVQFHNCHLEVYGKGRWDSIVTPMNEVTLTHQTTWARQSSSVGCVIHCDGFTVRCSRLLYFKTRFVAQQLAKFGAVLSHAAGHTSLGLPSPGNVMGPDRGGEVENEAAPYALLQSGLAHSVESATHRFVNTFGTTFFLRLGDHGDLVALPPYATVDVTIPYSKAKATHVMVYPEYCVDVSPSYASSEASESTNHLASGSEVETETDIHTEREDEALCEGAAEDVASAVESSLVDGIGGDVRCFLDAARWRNGSGRRLGKARGPRRLVSDGPGLRLNEKGVKRNMTCSSFLASELRYGHALGLVVDENLVVMSCLEDDVVAALPFAAPPHRSVATGPVDQMTGSAGASRFAGAAMASTLIGRGVRHRLAPQDPADDYAGMIVVRVHSKMSVRNETGLLLEVQQYAVVSDKEEPLTTNSSLVFPGCNYHLFGSCSTLFIRAIDGERTYTCFLNVLSPASGVFMELAPEAQRSGCAGRHQGDESPTVFFVSRTRIEQSFSCVIVLHPRLALLNHIGVPIRVSAWQLESYGGTLPAHPRENSGTLSLMRRLAQRDGLGHGESIPITRCTYDGNLYLGLRLSQAGGENIGTAYPLEVVPVLKTVVDRDPVLLRMVDSNGRTFNVRVSVLPRTIILSVALWVYNLTEYPLLLSDSYLSRRLSAGQMGHTGVPPSQGFPFLLGCRTTDFPNIFVKIGLDGTWSTGVSTDLGSRGVIQSTCAGSAIARTCHYVIQLPRIQEGRPPVILLSPRWIFVNSTRRRLSIRFLTICNGGSSRTEVHAAAEALQETTPAGVALATMVPDVTLRPGEFHVSCVGYLEGNWVSFRDSLEDTLPPVTSISRTEVRQRNMADFYESMWTSPIPMDGPGTDSLNLWTRSKVLPAAESGISGRSACDGVAGPLEFVTGRIAVSTRVTDNVLAVVINAVSETNIFVQNRLRTETVVVRQDRTTRRNVIPPCQNRFFLWETNQVPHVIRVHIVGFKGEWFELDFTRGACQARRCLFAPRSDPHYVPLAPFHVRTWVSKRRNDAVTILVTRRIPVSAAMESWRSYRRLTFTAPLLKAVWLVAVPLRTRGALFPLASLIAKDVSIEAFEADHNRTFSLKVDTLQCVDEFFGTVIAHRAVPKQPDNLQGPQRLRYALQPAAWLRLDDGVHHDLAISMATIKSLGGSLRVCELDITVPAFAIVITDVWLAYALLDLQGKAMVRSHTSGEGARAGRGRTRSSGRSRRNAERHSRKLAKSSQAPPLGSLLTQHEFIVLLAEHLVVLSAGGTAGVGSGGRSAGGTGAAAGPAASNTGILGRGLEVPDTPNGTSGGGGDGNGSGGSGGSGSRSSGVDRAMPSVFVERIAVGKLVLFVTLVRQTHPDPLRPALGMYTLMLPSRLQQTAFQWDAFVKTDKSRTVASVTSKLRLWLLDGLKRQWTKMTKLGKITGFVSGAFQPELEAPPAPLSVERDGGLLTVPFQPTGDTWASLDVSMGSLSLFAV